MNSEQKAKVFKALCDEKRIKILELLKGGEKCACVLIDTLCIAQSALSYHMKILTESGIVVGRADGKWVHYSIDESGVQTAQNILSELK